jgi:ABC-type branched-subunit amino acid transport system ATPase component
MSLLEVTGVRVTYGGAVLALEDATLTVPEGGSVALLGANGAGKTTLLRAVGGLLRHHRGEVRAGEIRFEGRAIAGRDAASLVASGIAQCLEGRRVFPELTVEENLRVGAFVARARAGERARRQEMLELFPRLGERLTQPAGLLSGGEQQMLAIARALMAGPQLLLLDEPSLGLAPLLVEEIAATLRRINEAGTAMLIVDQSTTLALHVTTHAYLLENGHTKAEGPTRELLRDDQVRASYLGTTAGHERVLAESQSQ